MGKKRIKTSSDPSTSLAEKRSKTSTEEPLPLPQLRKIRYEDMPLNHKKKFYIDDDCGSCKKYIGIISWLRTMGCLNGAVFEDIANLNWSNEDYPLVEVEVITPQNLSAKFIIYKMTMYVIAFYAHNRWFQFRCEFEIDIIDSTSTTLEGYDGKYTCEPWERIGPKSMINAVKVLADKDFVDASVTMKACEVFYVHLSEAARLYPVESLVCKSLLPIKVGEFDKRTYEDEEKIILTDKDDKHIEEKDDVYSLVKENGPVDLDLIVQSPNYIERLIRKYSIMSKIWYVYSLTEKKFFEMLPQYVSNFHMRSIKSLRCTLAILCNINLDKVLKEWKKKSEKHSVITPEVYKKMEMQVRELQVQKKVLLLKTGDHP